MPVGKSDYQINIKTSADVGAVETTREQIEKLRAATEGAEISHRDLHEAIELIGENAAGALGPLGELAHFLSNPYILAAAGASLAIKMLVDRHDQLVEQEKKAIAASEEMRRMFIEGIAEGSRQAAEKINDLVYAHDHLRDSVDLAAQSLDRELKIAQIVSAAMQEQLAATESLMEAKIKLAEAQGKITPEQGNAEIREYKRAEEALKETQEEQTQQGQAQAKREASAAAASDSAALLKKLKDMEPDLVSTDASVLTEQGRLKTLQDDAAKARDAATNARSEADNASIFAPGYVQKKAEASKLEDAAKAAEALVDGQIQHLAALQQLQKEMNRQADSLANQSSQRDEDSRKLAEEATEIDAEVKARKKSFDQRLATERQADQAENQTDTVNHVKELQEKIQSGRASAKDIQEWQDIQTQNKFSQTPERGIDDMVNKGKTALDQARYSVRTGRGDDSQLHSLLNEFIGLANDLHANAAQKGELSSLAQQVKDLRQDIAVSHSIPHLNAGVGQ